MIPDITPGALYRDDEGDVLQVLPCGRYAWVEVDGDDCSGSGVSRPLSRGGLGHEAFLGVEPLRVKFHDFLRSMVEDQKAEERIMVDLGVTERTVQSWCQGTRRPYHAVAVKLAGVLGLDPEPFAAWANDRPYENRGRTLQETNSAFGGLIRAARVAKKKSLQVVAAEIGVSAGALSNWELGHAKPSAELFSLVIRYLGVPDKDALDAIIRQ